MGKITMKNGSYPNFFLLITIIIFVKNIPSSWCSQVETLFLIDFHLSMLRNCTNLFFLFQGNSLVVSLALNRKFNRFFSPSSHVDPNGGGWHFISRNKFLLCKQWSDCGTRTKSSATTRMFGVFLYISKFCLLLTVWCVSENINISLNVFLS